MWDAFRRWRRSPESLLAEIGLKKGMKVADVGAGFGYFAFPASEIIGSEGVVYAVEPSPKRAEEISSRAKDREVKNIQVLVTGAEDMGAVAPGEVDVAMSISSFHHFDDPKKGLAEMRRIVRPGGLVYVRDMKAGRILKHGSVPDEFRRIVTGEFPDAEVTEERGFVVARARV